LGIIFWKTVLLASNTAVQDSEAKKDKNSATKIYEIISSDSVFLLQSIGMLFARPGPLNFDRIHCQLKTREVFCHFVF